MQSLEAAPKKGPARPPRRVIWLGAVSFLNDFSSEIGAALALLAAVLLLARYAF